MNLSGFFVYRPAAWLIVQGEDASEFLQGQFTCDLQLKTAHSCTYGLWLDRKGKVQGDSLVFRMGQNDFRIFSYESPAAALCTRLESFVIADDVSLADETDQVGGLSLFGEAAGGWLAEAGCRLDAEGFSNWESGVVFRGRRTTGPHLDLVTPIGAIPGLLARLRSLGLEELDGDAIERERIRSRRPAVPREIGPGDLPQEGGLEHDAVSFSKGCYLGQEVMARLRAMGRVRRGLVAVRVRASPKTPAVLFEGSRPVGELRTLLPAAGDEANGVALLRLDRAGSGFSLEPEGPVVVEAVGGSWGAGR